METKIDRRSFLESVGEALGASTILAGLGACSRLPLEKIVPYVIQPEKITPGIPLFFTTAFTVCGYATGILVESHMGRPTKIEGNPDHPASLGAADAITQAAILSLYQPDRAKIPIYRADPFKPAIKTRRQTGTPETWNRFFLELASHLAHPQNQNGKGIHLLTETHSSPTLGNQIQLLKKKFPLLVQHTYEPINRDQECAGVKMAFGKDFSTYFDMTKARVIASFDCDFLVNYPGSVRYAHDFSKGRRVFIPQTNPALESTLTRLYVVESTPTLTGAAADHRITTKPSLIAAYLLELAEKLGFKFLNSDHVLSESEKKWIAAVARDLLSQKGSGLIAIGRSQPAYLHALVQLLNHHLHNTGKSIQLTAPIEIHPTQQMESLQNLVEDLNQNKVAMLITLGGNPVYTAPSDLSFKEAYLKVPFRVHLSSYDNETSQLSHWHLPEAHFLEAWSDARAYDGTASLVQPLIAPLYSGKSAHDVINAMLGPSTLTAYDLIRDYWKNSWRSEDFENIWKLSLQLGAIPRSTPATESPNPSLDALKKIQSQYSLASEKIAKSFEIIFKPDPMILDGRFFSNSWLQEIYHPITQLSWDQAALISPKTAQEYQLSSEDMIEIQAGSHSGIHSEKNAGVNSSENRLQTPVWILPGHPDHCITLNLGFRKFNAYLIQNSKHPHFDSGFQIKKTGKTFPLASNHNNHSLEGRDIIHSAALTEFLKNPNLFGNTPLRPISLYPDPPNSEGADYSWGMSIDLNTCIGCKACVIACQAENNIPSVGKDQIRKGRDLYWIRVDSYFLGSQTVFQPVPCMHCEKAPCELVCPTAATLHDHEGLNEMIYNRYVGTRYCSNNCPYKVRRFNFFQYADYKTEVLKLQRNPDVTVRSRGVMEKCTYCVQRISEARINAEKEGRKIRDGEIKTACQQTCPTQSIVFGDIQSPKNQISKLKAQPQSYGLLASLGARPRTTYLAKLTHPDSEIVSG